MAKIITETIDECDDCQYQYVFSENLHCTKLNEDIFIPEGENFPFDCPLDDEF